MEKIASFTIDHTRLFPGVYVSRRDFTPAGDPLTTFDIRITRPNHEAAADPKALHSMEHLAATYLRNDPEWKQRVVYWGPMGCCTGNYLILQGELEPSDILDLLRHMFDFIVAFEGEIPGATARDCGNWTFNDLEGAKKLARKFKAEVLDNPSAEQLNYPQ